MYRFASSLWNIKGQTLELWNIKGSTDVVEMAKIIILPISCKTIFARMPQTYS